MSSWSVKVMPLPSAICRSALSTRAKNSSRVISSIVLLSYRELFISDCKDTMKKTLYKIKRGLFPVSSQFVWHPADFMLIIKIAKTNI